MLLKMLPHYYAHVCKYENTLITKFFGLHRIKLAGGHKVFIDEGVDVYLHKILVYY